MKLYLETEVKQSFFYELIIYSKHGFSLFLVLVTVSVVLPVDTALYCFHLMYVKINLRSVTVAEWPLFGKDLLIRLTVCYLCNMSIFNVSYFPIRITCPCDLAKVGFTGVFIIFLFLL